MKEEQLNTLRQQDINLRDALKLDEAELPQMPADLNARVMQRATQQPRKTTVRRIWPWLAAACVVGFIIVNLMPPKASSPISLQGEGGVVAEKESQPEVETPSVEQPSIEQPSAELPIKHSAQTRVKRMVAKVQPAKVEVSEPVAEEPLLAQEVATPETEKKTKVEPTVTLTERDIPITRPENYKYTPEEIALMKKQANEAYLKWAQLELEIAKHNLEQTAQK